MPDSAPAGVQDEGSRQGNFEAQSQSVGSRCLRFAVEVTRHHARLASGCGPGSAGRDWFPLGSNERFHILRWFSFPELLGTRTQLVIDSSCVPVSAPRCASLRSNAFSMNILVAESQEYQIPAAEIRPGALQRYVNVSVNDVRGIST